MRSDPITLFLCGDVMTGRGIDQILPRPCDPTIYEVYVRSATDYLALAEQAHGAIPKPVDFAYIWGDALPELERRRPDARIVNLETAITCHETYARKGINYRMSPRNVPCLAAAGIDCCVLANNHVLDWERPGLLDTLDALRAAGIRTAGAGATIAQAETPAIIDLSGGRRLIVFAFGSETGGVPPAWTAAVDRAGVSFLADLDDRSIDRISEQVRQNKRPGDVVVVSVHWGPNWGYSVSREQIAFAHKLVERAGVDVIHGHSSHHPKGIEVYHGKAILYGCGDLLNDYEGIGGYEEFRDDLTLMYFLAIRPGDGRLVELTMKPLQIRRFRLTDASPGDAAWLHDALNRASARFGTRIKCAEDDLLMVDLPA